MDKTIKNAFIISALCVISLYLKPAGMQMLIPAIFLFVMYEYLIAKSVDFRFFVITGFILLLPTIFISIQTFAMFFNNEVGKCSGGLAFGFLQIYKHYSQNVFVSLIISIAFPVFILMTNFKKAISDKFYLLTLIGFIVALLEACFINQINDDGLISYSGNLTWAAMLGIFLWFSSSTIIFIRNFDAYSKVKKERINYAIATVLYSLHTLSGVYYYLILALSPAVH